MTGLDARLVAAHIAMAMGEHRTKFRAAHQPLPDGLDLVEALYRAWSTGSGTPVIEPVPPVPRLLLTFDEVAVALATSKATVKRLVVAGDLPAVQLLGQRRVRVADLDAYLESLAGGAGRCRAVQGGSISQSDAEISDGAHHDQEDH
ncbi:hypothetical protein BH10ACT1_BH10ACT1_33330 [soil metagenome]